MQIIPRFFLQYQNIEIIKIFLHDKAYIFLEGFVHVMAHACCMITNSSSGIREAASFGTPVINIGLRQKNRERNDNVIDIYNNYETLDSLIENIKTIGFSKNNIYYKKGCSKLIVEKLIKTIKHN